MNKEERKYCENDVKVTKDACKTIKKEKIKKIGKKVAIFAAGAAAGVVGSVLVYKRLKNGSIKKDCICINVQSYTSPSDQNRYVRIEMYRDDLPELIFGKKAFRIGGGWTPEHAIEIGNALIDVAGE